MSITNIVKSFERICPTLDSNIVKTQLLASNDYALNYHSIHHDRFKQFDL